MTGKNKNRFQVAVKKWPNDNLIPFVCEAIVIAIANTG